MGGRRAARPPAPWSVPYTWCGFGIPARRAGCHRSARRLYRELAFSSTFQYLTAGLGFDEGAAMMRIRAARVALVHPFVLDLLAEGRLHLTGISLLAPHLDQDGTGADLIRETIGRSRRQIEAMLAERSPKPDVAPAIHRPPRSPKPDVAPAIHRPPRSTGGGPDAGRSVECPDVSPASAEPVASSAMAPGHPHPEPPAPPRSTTLVLSAELEPGRPPTPMPPSPHPEPPAHPIAPAPSTTRADLTPLGTDRFKVQFMATGDQVERLRELQDLLSHQVPSGDLAEVLDRAVTALRDALLKKRLGCRRSAARPDPGVAAEGERAKSGGAPREITDPGIGDRAPRESTDRGFGGHVRDETTGPGVGGAGSQTAEGPGGGEARRRGPDAAPSQTTPQSEDAARHPSPERSRYVRTPVRRAVFERDGHRCTYVDAEGRRCAATRQLTLDHAPVPFSRGGPSTVDNLRVRCWAHNQETAWKQLGPRFMRRRIEANRRSSGVSRSDESLRGSLRPQAP